MFQQTLAREKNRNNFLIVEADTSCHMRASQLGPTKGDPHRASKGTKQATKRA